MGKTLRRGFGRHMLPIPDSLWQKRILGIGRRMEAKVGVMDYDHRTVHHFVVRELPRRGGPITPEWISENLDMSNERVTAILDELEKRKVFLVKNSEGSVLWAYPVTAEQTPHRLSFSTGEEIFAA